MPSPRDYLNPPAAFGRVDRADFYLPPRHSRHGLLGAVVHHYLAIRAREMMVLHGLSSDAVGHEAGLNARTVDNVPGGQTGMNMQLAAALLSLGGPDAWPNPQNMHRLVARARTEYDRRTRPATGGSPP